MKPYLCFLSALSILLSSGCVGSPTASAQSPVPVRTVVLNAPTPLEELVAPIALYPDALIALILPAATASSDVVLAARYLNASGDPNGVDQQPWDDSVKGLAHYPEVVKWMDDNLSWTQRIGEAYLAQPDQVMTAVQLARARAREKGLLVDNPQQQIVVESSTIRIVPAQPDVIYVPRYDPEIIYLDRPVYYSEPWITFGIGFGVGTWLSYDCDWRSRTIWVDRHRWDNGRDHDWRHPHFPGRSDYVSRDNGWHQWHPVPNRPHPTYRHFDRPGGRDFSRPAPIPGTPWAHRENDHNGHWRGGNDRDRDDDANHDRSHEIGRDERRQQRPERSAEQTRPFVQPNRVAAPQSRPTPVTLPPTASVQSNRRLNPGVPAPRRWQAPANAGEQSGGFTDQRSRPERRRGIAQPTAPVGNPSSVVNNSSPAISREAPALEMRTFNRPAQVTRQAEELPQLRTPHRVAAPAMQSSPAMAPATRVAVQPALPAAVQSQATRVERAQRSDPTQRNSDNRETGRYRRDREPDR